MSKARKESIETIIVSLSDFTYRGNDGLFDVLKGDKLKCSHNIYFPDKILHISVHHFLTGWVIRIYSSFIDVKSDENRDYSLEEIRKMKLFPNSDHSGVEDCNGFFKYFLTLKEYRNVKISEILRD